MVKITKWKMNKVKIIIVLCFVLLLIGIVIADRFIDNRFRYGTIDEDGDLQVTNTPINNVNIIGFICADSSCSSISGTLWNGDEINSGDDKIQLVYPTSLSNHGYGVYSYKDTYIPYEVYADWYGTNPADPQGPFDNYLTRKEICIAEIENFQVEQNSDVDISLDVLSPIENAGPLDYVPASIQEHYEVNLDVHLNVSKDGLSYHTESENIDVEYSNSEHVEFSFPLFGNGLYEIYVYTETNDGKCIDYEIDDEQETIFIGECQVDGDCPEDYNSSAYCLGNDSYYNFHDFSCISNECSESIIQELIEDCGEDSFGDWNYYCIGQDRYRNRTYTDRGCSGGSCFENTTIEDEFVQNCPEACVDGQCQNVTCHDDSECGLGTCFESDNYCSGLELYNNYTTIICVDPGQADSYCEIEYHSDKIADCMFNCQDGRCVV